VFHARVEHGGTIVSRKGVIEVLQSKNDSLGGTMVYPYWHPGGRYLAFSTNKTSQMFHLANRKRIEVYDSSSDVFIYDTETHTILTDTLIMKKLWAENTPAFSPDGRWLYFTTARRQVYPTDYDKERYSLCRVGFDEQTGSIGTKVDTLICAAQTGKSVTWPRPSYDGRYIMYTQTDYGYFSIWHPEADLWLLDLKTGEKRPLDEVNTERAESLHSWALNSRWFLFTSRRDDGLYSRIYFATIDEHGRATKPFMLPQRNPKDYYRRLLDSYNTPDFTTRKVSTDVSDLIRSVESQERKTTTVN
jgi:Tol biopolymer transport system component